MEIDVLLGERRVGLVAQAPGGEFSFTYDDTWLAWRAVPIGIRVGK